MTYILALDQGTTSTRSILFRGPISASPRSRSRSSRNISRGPAGSSTTRRTCGAPRVATMREALARGGVGVGEVAALGLTNQRETDVVWERRDGQGDRAGHRLAGPPHGGSLRAAEGGRRRGRGQRQDRPAARSLFLRHQDRLVARPRAKARGRAPRRANSPSAPSIPSSSTASPAARCTRPTPPTRRARCFTTSTSGAWDEGLCRLLARAHGDAAGGARLRRRFRLRHRRPVRPAAADPRRRGRSAGRDGRAGVLLAGHDEIDLRHRLLRAAQHRDDAGRLEKPAAHHGRLSVEAASAPMRSKARSSSPAPPCNGCATGSA